MNSATHLLLVEVGEDDEQAEGQAVPFALGEEQAVWIATVAYVLQQSVSQSEILCSGLDLAASVYR
jgi:hypothetical protein